MSRTRTGQPKRQAPVLAYARSPPPGWAIVAGTETPSSASLRVGIGPSATSPAEDGVKQFISNISNEGLLRVNQEGRLEPWLAEGWDRSPDGLRLVIRLRPNVKFHDGSSVDADVVAKVLNESLAKTMRSTFEDVESIRPDGHQQVVITFRRPSSLVADALMDVPITRNSTAKCSEPAPTASAVLRPRVCRDAGVRRLLSRPTGHRANRRQTYPNGRSAWAEMLRERLDVLYEVVPKRSIS